MTKRQISIILIILCVAISAFAQPPAKTSDDEIEYKEFVLKQIASIHGGNGPFAVAGFRMGNRALEELKLLKGSFDFDATHESLPEVGWACVADGIQAATGTSPGKMNLRVAYVKDAKDVQSVIINKKTGTKIVFRRTAAFMKKYGATPYAELDQVGREVMNLKDEEIFQMEIVKGKDDKPSPFEKRRQSKGEKQN